MGSTPLTPRCRKPARAWKDWTGKWRMTCGQRIRREDLTGRVQEPVVRSTLYRQREVRPREFVCPKCGGHGWTTHPDLAGEE